MAWVEKLPSGRHRGVAVGPGGKRCTATFPTVGAARRWAADTEADIRSPGWKPPQTVTVGEWHQMWVKARPFERTTLVEVDRRWRRHLAPAFAATRITDIRPLQVQTWVTALSKDMAPAGVRSCHAQLSGMLTDAVREGVIGANPAAGVRLPQRTSRPHRYLNAEEAAGLLQRAGDWYPLVLAGLHTGMRWGELAGLHAHRVHPQRAVLEVVETLTLTTGGAQVKAYPKNSSSRRVLPLTPQLAGALTGLPPGLVFTTSGRPLSRWNWRRRVWQPLVEGMAPPLPRFHDLRHTYASWLVQAGVPLPEVMARMGHSSIQTTMLYAHLAPDGNSRVLAALARGGNVGNDHGIGGPTAGAAVHQSPTGAAGNG